ncbi:AraC family transcriptional regulator [Leucobacter luti]|nr:AraC family transcriptional regulator [Leucobacter luti]
MPGNLLTDYPVACTSSPGRLRDAVDGLTGYDHAVLGPAMTQRRAAAPDCGARQRAAPLRELQPGRVNGLRFESLSLVFVAYGTRVQVVAPPTREQVVLVVPLGPMRVEVGGHGAQLTTPFALSSSMETTMHPDPSAGALVGAVPVAELTAQLCESFGAEREFAVDLAQPRPIPLNAAPALHRVWSEFAGRPTLDPTPLFDRLVIGLAPYVSYGSALRPDPVGVGAASAHPLVSRSSPPPYLTHAARYLRRHLADPISLTELGTIVGIGSRQLQLAFQAHLGCTAQEYLRNARLDQAWSVLRERAPGSGAGGERNVAAVAAEVGIPHSGRFSQYFFERFGVLPSAVRGA